MKKSLTAETLLRSYPVGAFIKGEGALDWKWWEKKDTKLPIMFGLLRPGLTLKTSAVVNTVSPFLEFYPISILGFYIRQSWSNRNMTEIGGFNCDLVDCKADNISRFSYGMKLALGYKKIFLVTKQKWTKIDLKDSHSRDFADEITTMVAHNTGDDIHESLLVFGYKLTDEYSLGLLKQDNFMKKTNQQTRMHLVFLSQKHDKYNAMLGLGTFRTRDHANNATILFNLKWPIYKGFALF